MSHTSEPTRPQESDDQSKRSSQGSTLRRGTSPAQSQQKQGSFSQTDHSESVVNPKERVRNKNRSSSDSDSDSEIVPKSKNSAVSGENLKTAASAAGGQVELAGGSLGTQSVNSGSFGGGVSGERRKGRFRKEVIQLPPTQGSVRQVRHRMPTPEPDTIERVLVQRTGPECIEEITEIPTTPPPLIQERTVVEPAGPPQVVKRVIRVPPRGGGFAAQQTAAPVQYNDNFLPAGGFTNNQQQATTSYAPSYGTETANFTTGFNPPQPPTSYGGGYTSFGATGVQQQAPITFSVAAGQSQVLPPIGCNPAFCFYI